MLTIIATSVGGAAFLFTNLRDKQPALQPAAQQPIIINVPGATANSPQTR